MSMRQTWALSLVVLLACGDDASSAPQPSAGAAGSGGSLQAGAGGVAGQAGAAGQAGQAGQAGAAGQGGAAGQAGQAGAGGAVVPVRSVENRSPFGDLSAAKNMVLDGDFEFSPASSIVPAWLAIKDQQEVVPVVYQTGGLCDSGIYCARIPAGVTLANFAVSLPPGEQVKASLRLRPESGACDGAAQVYLYSRISTLDAVAELTPQSASPDESGWCTFQVKHKVGKLVTSAAFYVITDKVSVVVDHAIIASASTAPPSSIVAPASLPQATLGRLRNLERFRLRRPARLPAR